MKFGLFYVLECPDHDYKRAYREMLEQIEFSEEMGFESVWLAEHHGSDYGSMPTSSIAAAAVAARTTKLRIGIAASILPFGLNPVKLAEEWAMVDNISGGRLDLGVGRGYQPREFEMLGLGGAMGDSRQIFKEYLEAMIGLWTNDTFSYHGKYVNFDNVDVRPKPVQQPHPPIFVAAISPETFSMVAEQGYNMLVTPTLMILPELIEFVVDAKRKLIAHGRDPLSLDFPMNWQIHVAESEQKALDNTNEAFLWYFDEVMKHVPQGANVPKTYERYGELAAAAQEMGGLTLDGLRQGGIVLLGTPQTAIDEIEKLRDEMGLQSLCCWMRMGGLEHEKVMSSIEQFGKHVIPAFKDRPNVVPKAIRESVTV